VAHVAGRVAHGVVVRGVIDGTNMEANSVRAPPPTFLVQLGRIFFKKCVMACMQMAGLLISCLLMTHRGTILIFVNYLYGVILIHCNEYIINANRNEKKMHMFCLMVASVLGYRLGATLVGRPVMWLLWMEVHSLMIIIFLTIYGLVAAVIMLRLELFFWNLEEIDLVEQIRSVIVLYVYTVVGTFVCLDRFLKLVMSNQG